MNKKIELPKLYEAAYLVRRDGGKSDTIFWYVYEHSFSAGHTFLNTKEMLSDICNSKVYEIFINHKPYLIGKGVCSEGKFKANKETLNQWGLEVDESPESLENLIHVLAIANRLIPNFNKI
ncbi:MAG: hypothetical protein QXH80_03695 [Candidatus Nanoarchaeia archaeon]